MMHRLILVTCAAMVIAGCQLVPDRSQVVIQLYDLGIPTTREVLPCCQGQVVLSTVRGAPMLASQNMWYRRSSESVAPTAFAVSRWAATPAALVEQHLRVGLRLAESDRFDGTPYRMTLKVEAMEQVFSADLRQAEVLLIVSATLSRTANRQVVENRVFRLLEPAPSADPIGGATGHAALADALVEQVQDWMCRIVGEDAETRSADDEH